MLVQVINILNNSYYCVLCVLNDFVKERKVRVYIYIDGDYKKVRFFLEMDLI